jgi:hypothetical protein
VFGYEALMKFYLFRHSLCVNLPLAVMSRLRSAVSSPVQKRCKITPSGNNKSGLACCNIENLAQAVPIDSFSHCSKSRIALGREPIWDTGKKARQNLSLSSTQSAFMLSTASVYHYFALPVREKENNFHLKVSCVMPEMLSHEYISLKSSRCWQGFSSSCPKKGNA